MSAAGVAGKMLGAGARALGWAAKHPIASDAGIGAAAGFVMSGFSGWGAMTGAVGGLVGGMPSRGQAASAQRNMVAARQQYKTSQAGIRFASKEVGIMERGYRRAQMDYRVSQKMYRDERSSFVGHMKASPFMPSSAVRAKLGSMNQAESAFKLAGTERLSAREGLMSARSNRASATKMASNSKANLLSAFGKRASLKGPRRFMGAAIGGGAAGLGTAIIPSMFSVGSSYGSQNQNPYGATFSGMGNGTVGGY